MEAVSSYQDFLIRKQQLGSDGGFEPLWMPDFLFDFQKHLVEWAVRKGRGAIFADCGLGKTPMQLVWAENVCRKTDRPVMVMTPLAVSQQTKREADKFGIDAQVSRDGKVGPRITITNYEPGDTPFQADLVREFADYKGDQKANLLSHRIWRRIASPVWMDIRRKRMLGHGADKEKEEEKHVCPLQMDVVERCLLMWSNPGENVLTPFMGIGSEVFGAVQYGRRGIGVELKPTYYRQAVKHLRSLDVQRNGHT